MVTWNRIMVTGNAGAGKSTVAARLGELLNRDVTGLDSVVWGPGWSRPSQKVQVAAIDSIATRPQWLVDGVSMRLCRAADVIVFLDVPRRTCYRRVLKRNLPYWFRSRPGLPEDCPEYRIIGTLVKIIWRFDRHVRPKIIEELERDGKDEIVFHIRTERDLDRLYDAVSPQGGRG